MLVNALAIALLVLGAILLALTVTFSGMGDVPGRLEYRASRFFLSPGIVMLAILAVCLALGPGPPEVRAGSSNVSCASVSTDNGASSNLSKSP
jgi:hypothetical protein